MGSMLTKPTPAASGGKRVLFVCSHNSNRSIAAEVIARKERPDLVVASAGVDAAGKLNPVTLKALEERGYSTAGVRSKGVADPEIGGVHNNWDVIVMMGCLTAGLPESPPSTTLVEDWGLPDPAADPSVLDSVIKTIQTKVKAL